MNHDPAAADPDISEPGQLTARTALRMSLTLLGALALVLGGYELVERLWLQGADPKFIQELRVIRGISVAAVAAVLVMVVLLRSPPPLATRASLPRTGPLPTLASLTENRLGFYSRWFVQLRWIALVLAAVVILLTVVAAELLPHDALLPLSAIILGLAVFNSLMWILSQRDSAGEGLLRAQVYVDLVALNTMLHFSGGIENPLYILALFHVIISGIIFSRRQCFTVAIFAGTLLGALAMAEWAHLLDHYTLGLVPHGHEGNVHASHSAIYVACIVGIFCGSLLLTAHFVTRLSDQLREDERQIEDWATQAVNERRLLEQALATTSTGVRVLDADLQVRWANQKWRDWFGQNQGIAWPREWASSRMRDLVESGEVWSREIECSSPDGTDTRFIRVITAPIATADHRDKEIVDFAQDVTKEKEEQAKMLRASQLATIGELASHVAHEVNNPIAILSAKAHLLISNFGSELPEKVRVDLEKIIDLADRVANISQGLLSYSRTSTGAREQIDITSPITESLDLVRQRVGNKDIEVHLEYDGLEPSVHANVQELGQVFLNLLLNAVDAMPDGGDLWIRTMRRVVDDVAGVAIEVEDSGSGIATQHREHIFEPFFTTKEAGSGTGLGLSICYGLVRSHGGHITVKSEPGRGTRFTIWLPGAESSSRRKQ